MIQDLVRTTRPFTSQSKMSSPSIKITYSDSPASVSSKSTSHSISSMKELVKSPQSEFAYDDAYNYGEDFDEAINKRTKSGKSKAKKSRRSSIMLTPPDHSTIECNDDESEKDVTSSLPTNMVVNTTTPPVRVAMVVKRAQTTTSKAQLSSEELLMRKIESEKAAEFARTMKARKLYLLLKSKSVDHPPPTVASTTTVKRKEKVVKKVQIRKVVKSSQALAMRSRKVTTTATASSSKKTITGNTIVEPFQFATDKRIMTTTKKTMMNESKLSNSMGCATPVAEKALKFMKDARSHGAPVQAARHITLPKSPYLRTKRRGDYAAKSNKLKSREELLEEEMTAIKSKPFKARLLDRRIFESSGEMGVPKIAARPVTEPSCFELKSDARAKQARIHMNNNNNNNIDHVDSTVVHPSTAFKARPLPAFVTDKSKIPVLPIPACKADFKSTVAVSPKFHSMKRSTSAPLPPNRKSSDILLEAKTKEEHLNASKKNIPLKLTEPQEFKLSTDSRGEYYQRQLKRQIEQEEQRNEAARTVHATPIPKSSRSGFHLQPKVTAHKIPSTEMKPFKLRSEHRHSEVQEELSKKVSAIEIEQQKNSQFHARPVPSTTYKPNAIIVDNTERDLVIPMAVSLESDKRALKRLEFDKQMEEKLCQIQEMKALLVRQQRDMEEKRIQEIRRKSIDEGGLLFKAQPILTKDPYPAKTTTATTTPLQCTTPLSPNLRTKARSLMRSNHHVDSVMNSSSSGGGGGGGGMDNQNGRDITTSQHHHHHGSSTKHMSSASTTTSKTIISTRPLLDATSHQSNALATAIQML